MSPRRRREVPCVVHRPVRAVSPVVKSVLEAIGRATAAGVEAALASDDEAVALEAARAALMSAQSERADAAGAAKFPTFRSE